MASDDRATSAISAASESDIVARFEDGILSRRSFLAGLVLGGVGGAGAAFGVTRSDAGFQSLATLAGGATIPADTQYYLPAVKPVGDGLVIPVNFDYADGDGGLFVNLNGIEVRHDLQMALHEAVETATQLTDRSLEGVTVQVTFGTSGADVLALRGKSWEAGLTVALIASLRQQSLSRDTLVTGVVNRDGELLPVGGIEEKATAAKAFGATELLVPPGQASGIDVRGLRIVSVGSISTAVDRVLE